MSAASQKIEKWTVEYQAPDGSVKKKRMKGDPDRILASFKNVRVLSISGGWQ